MPFFNIFVLKIWTYFLCGYFLFFIIEMDLKDTWLDTKLANVSTVIIIILLCNKNPYCSCNFFRDIRKQFLLVIGLKGVHRKRKINAFHHMKQNTMITMYKNIVIV